jgi:hypothetical protein
MNELFSRSKLAREMIVQDIFLVADLCIGIKTKLPPPEKVAIDLKFDFLEILTQWDSKYGVRFPDLHLATLQVQENMRPLVLRREKELEIARDRECRLQALKEERSRQRYLRSRVGLREHGGEFAALVSQVRSLLQIALENAPTQFQQHTSHEKEEEEEDEKEDEQDEEFSVTSRGDRLSVCEEEKEEVVQELNENDREEEEEEEEEQKSRNDEPHVVYSHGLGGDAMYLTIDNPQQSQALMVEGVIPGETDAVVDNLRERLGEMEKRCLVKTLRRWRRHTIQYTPRISERTEYIEHAKALRALGSAAKQIRHDCRVFLKEVAAEDESEDEEDEEDEAELWEFEVTSAPEQAVHSAEAHESTGGSTGGHQNAGQDGGMDASPKPEELTEAERKRRAMLAIAPVLPNPAMAIFWEQDRRIYSNPGIEREHRWMGVSGKEKESEDALPQSASEYHSLLLVPRDEADIALNYTPLKRNHHHKHEEGPSSSSAIREKEKEKTPSKPKRRHKLLPIPKDNNSKNTAAKRAKRYRHITNQVMEEEMRAHEAPLRNFPNQWTSFS